MSEAKEIFLKDYQQPNFWIEETQLTIDLTKPQTRVTAKLKFFKNNNTSERSLFLNGEGPILDSISLNGVEVGDNLFEKKDDGLYFGNIDQDTFELTIVNFINPNENYSGQGLYKSGNIYCTQCEAEGFRKITYYLDRPDVMASFKTKLIAAKDKFPYLLSNGNKVESGELEGGNHYAVWEDPHKKPSYLFACVFGDLAVVKDEFVTKSGKKVDLEIYVDHGNEAKCEHAMRSLKNAMKWDEETYNLEYDLDIYMIVAVDTFNAGAMENKGLNIFNSAYVLATPKLAVDKDFQNIEGVIGHEYFHNWTGNRVTCRDWFQLTLKEGLTVYRDQEFSSDMLDRSVKRIEDVIGLKSHQFPEDDGPLSHPIQPKSFVEIDNFYTSTVYEKGAEVIRMIETIIGKENFKKGLELYFKRFDGQAVTTDDFVNSMSDASGVDLSHFKLWYDQNGTPKIKVNISYDQTNSIVELSLEQENLKLNNDKFDCLYLPFSMKFYNENGAPIESMKGHENFIFKNKKQSIKFEGVNERVIPSLNCNFSAPVKVDYDYKKEELATLMAHDEDLMNRYDASQRLIELEIKELKKSFENKEASKLSDLFLKAYKTLLLDKSLTYSFRANALSIPTIFELNKRNDFYDFDSLPMAVDFLNEQLAIELESELNLIISNLGKEVAYDISPEEMGKRSFKNFCLSLYAQTTSPAALDLVYANFQRANNMTDELGALKTLSHINSPYREKALESFYANWKHEPLVFEKWVRVKAGSRVSSLSETKDIMKLEAFDLKVPNLIRALCGGFISGSPLVFHDPSGVGYEFIADRVIELDKDNPNIAAGICKNLNFLKRVDSTRQAKLKDQLNRILNEAKSANVIEIAKRNLEN